MLTMQFLIVLTLFAVQSLAKPSVYEDFSDNDECKLDLLIIWDNSNSIGETDFKDKVKDFFRDLINSEKLNVGPDGTHIAIITFSTQAKTKVLLEFGNKTTKEDLLHFIDVLTWLEVGGAATRTGMALMLANQVFNQNAPLNGGNGRQNVPDIAMILTDGIPFRNRGDRTYGFQDFLKKPYEEFARGARSTGETKMANASAESLRDKGVRIVGVSIGRYGDLELLKKWTTTQSDAIQTDIAEFDKIVSTMVNKSCQKTDCTEDPTNPECIKPGVCDCARTTAIEFVNSGESGAEVYWEIPPLICSANLPVVEKLVVNPAGTVSPKFFGVGNHVISYTYTYQDGRDNSKTHTCYLDVQVQVCDCPSKDLGVFYTRHNDPTCPVGFEVPKPDCLGLNYVNMYTSGVHDSYQIGKHTPTYTYVMSNGRKVDCHLNFEVKVIPCSGKQYNPDKEVCCHGQLHAKQNQWKCCGTNYFDGASQKCCSDEYANFVPKAAECPNACKTTVEKEK